MARWPVHGRHGLSERTQQHDPRAPDVRGPAQYVAFVGMCLIWGTTFLGIRLGNEAVPPLWAAMIRLGMAAVLNALIALVTGVRWPSGSALRGVALFGFLNMGLNFAFLYWGEQTVPSGIAATLYATIPLTTGIFAWLLGVHGLVPKQMIAAAIGLLGVALIFSGELQVGGPPVPLLLVFAGATLAALSGVILKRVPPHSTFAVNAVAAAVGALVCLAGSFVTGESHTWPRTFREWAPIIYLVLAGNLGAYVLYAWLITQWKVTSVSVAALVIPVIAVIVGALVRSEAPAPLTYLGGAVVLSGVALALRTEH